MIALLLTAFVSITPTLLDRSDYDVRQIWPTRTITQEHIVNGGYIESLSTLAPNHFPECGILDNNVAEYYSYEDETGWAFVPRWRISAIVSRDRGLLIFGNNNEIIYEQHQPYTEFFARVKMEVKGDELWVYLNGELMDVSKHPGLQFRDLRGWFYDSVILPSMGYPVRQTKNGVHLTD
jgi:hypothetical protein